MAPTRRRRRRPPARSRARRARAAGCTSQPTARQPARGGDSSQGWPKLHGSAAASWLRIPINSLNLAHDSRANPALFASQVAAPGRDGRVRDGLAAALPAGPPAADAGPRSRGPSRHSCCRPLHLIWFLPNERAACRKVVSRSTARPARWRTPAWSGLSPTSSAVRLSPGGAPARARSHCRYIKRRTEYVRGYGMV